MPTKKKLTPHQRALANGYRSGLEDDTAELLQKVGIPFQYEEKKVQFIKPARNASYTPDFILPNGVIVETKGRFVTEDRQKMILIRKQHPDLDIRMVFSNPNTRISKGSPTTYGMWCERHGFYYVKAPIPLAWANEPVNEASLAAIEKAGIKPELPT